MTRLTLDAFDQTLSDIYESALNPAHWDVAMTSLIHRPVSPPHWDVAFLIWERLNPPTGRFVGAHGVNDFARAAYLQAFTGRFSWSQAAHGLPTGEVVLSDELTPRDEFKASPLYQQFLANWGLEMAIIGSVDRSGADRLGLVLPGPDARDVDDLVDAVRRYLPHIQRATRISRKLGETDLRAANAEGALQHAPCATLILGDLLEVQFCNQLGQKLLFAGFADLQNGKLRLKDRQAQQALLLLASGESPGPSVALKMATDTFDELHILAMRMEQPVSDGLGGPIKGGRLVLVATQRETSVSPELIDRYRAWFDLTPSEARLAAMLARGLTLDYYAGSYGVSVNAARFLLKGIFAKTGVHKQPELVALLRDAPEGWIAHTMPLPSSQNR